LEIKGYSMSAIFRASWCKSEQHWL